MGHCNMEDNAKVVVLQRSEHLGFGFSIIGGSGTDLPPLICDIVEGSPADSCEELKVGDVIVAVNNVQVDKLTTKQVLKILRLSESSLSLVLQSDPVVKQRAERFLYCPPEDVDTLRDAISQRDLTGVQEIIVKRHGSPLLSPKKVSRIPANQSLGGKRSSRMPRKMEHDSNMNGKSETKMNLPRGIVDSQSPATLENGVTVKEPDGNSPVGRRFETFVMTGDMIIKTTSPHHKPETIKHTSAEKRKDGGAKEDELFLVTNSPKSSPKKELGTPKKAQGKLDKSRIPRPSTPKNSPKHSPKQSPKTSPKRSGLPVKSIHKPPSGAQKTVVIKSQDSTVPPRDVHKPDVYSSGPNSPHHRPNDLELLGYTRYPDIPHKLDIPPDDISSEDEKYMNDSIIDVDTLPPPPDEFFHMEESKPRDDIEISSPHINVMCANRLHGGGASPPPPPPPPPPPGDKDNSDTFYNSQVPNGANNHQALYPQDRSQFQAEHPQNGDFPPSPAASFLAAAMETEGNHPGLDLDMDIGLPTNTYPPLHVRHASEGDSVIFGNTTQSQNSSEASDKRCMVGSKSAEKITNQRSKGGANPGMGVRSSKSHENYLDEEGITLVDIDLEENLASSVDALHYEKSCSSIDSLSHEHLMSFAAQSRSLDNSPEKRTFDNPAKERVFMPAFITLEEPRSISKIKEGGKVRDVARPEESPSGSPSKRSTPADDELPPSYSEVTQGLDDVCASDNNSAHTNSTECSPQHPRLEGTSESPPPLPPPGDGPDMLYIEHQNQTQGALHTVSSATSVAEMAVTEQMPHPAEAVAEQSRSPTHKGSGDAANGATRFTQFDDKSHDPLCQDWTYLENPHLAGQDVAGVKLNKAKNPASPSHSHGDADSVYHQPIKDPHRPSAARLAKRLFNTDGFKKKDISRHLSKKNEFSQLVGYEYLKYFQFDGMALDLALRFFLKHLTLSGETQERERVLAHFSRRFVDCNPTTFNSEDACHTLTCALMLLNTDLHGQNIGRKMTLGEFVENLSDLNDGDNFPHDILRDLYMAIKTDPLECEYDEEDLSEMDVAHRALAAAAAASGDPTRFMGHNPFLDVPDPSKATEYKKGYIMRKSCVDPDGRKTAMGRRGWKMFYMTLRDMVLYIHKDEHGFKKNAMVTNMGNVIRIHHALATPATDYKKKQHVLRLQTSDWAEYLFQTSDSTECQEWIDTINFVAASLSAPPLPGGVGSQNKFQRPLLPSSFTRYNLREQFQHQEQRVVTIDLELTEHRRYTPEKGAKARVIQEFLEKEAYLAFELKRFKTYVFLLQSKMASYPELEPSLVEVAIGEVDEPPSPPNAGSPPPSSKQEHSTVQTRAAKPVKRSMSDRDELLQVPTTTPLPLPSAAPLPLTLSTECTPHLASRELVLPSGGIARMSQSELIREFVKPHSESSPLNQLARPESLQEAERRKSNRNAAHEKYMSHISEAQLNPYPDVAGSSDSESESGEVVLISSVKSKKKNKSSKKSSVEDPSQKEMPTKVGNDKSSCEGILDVTDPKPSPMPPMEYKDKEIPLLRPTSENEVILRQKKNRRSLEEAAAIAVRDSITGVGAISFDSDPLVRRNSVAGSRSSAYESNTIPRGPKSPKLVATDQNQNVQVSKDEQSGVLLRSSKSFEGALDQTEQRLSTSEKEKRVSNSNELKTKSSSFDKDLKGSTEKRSSKSDKDDLDMISIKSEMEIKKEKKEDLKRQKQEEKDEKKKQKELQREESKRLKQQKEDIKKEKQEQNKTKNKNYGKVSKKLKERKEPNEKDQTVQDRTSENLPVSDSVLKHSTDSRNTSLPVVPIPNPAVTLHSRDVPLKSNSTLSHSDPNLREEETGNQGFESPSYRVLRKIHGNDFSSPVIERSTQSLSRRSKRRSSMHSMRSFQYPSLTPSSTPRSPDHYSNEPVTPKASFGKDSILNAHHNQATGQDNTVSSGSRGAAKQVVCSRQESFVSGLYPPIGAPPPSPMSVEIPPESHPPVFNYTQPHTLPHRVAQPLSPTPSVTSVDNVPASSSDPQEKVSINYLFDRMPMYPYKPKVADSDITGDGDTTIEEPPTPRFPAGPHVQLFVRGATTAGMSPQPAKPTLPPPSPRIHSSFSATGMSPQPAKPTPPPPSPRIHSSLSGCSSDSHLYRSDPRRSSASSVIIEDNMMYIRASAIPKEDSTVGVPASGEEEGSSLYARAQPVPMALGRGGSSVKNRPELIDTQRGQATPRPTIPSPLVYPLSTPNQHRHNKRPPPIPAPKPSSPCNPLAASSTQFPIGAFPPLSPSSSSSLPYPHITPAPSQMRYSSPASSSVSGALPDASHVGPPLGLDSCAPASHGPVHVASTPSWQSGSAAPMQETDL